jgi:site-specific recombinase XerD
MPTDVAGVTREHVEAWIVHLLGRFRPATAALRYRSLQQFFGWLVDEGEITESPMRRMRPPTVPEEPPPVLSTSDPFSAGKGLPSSRVHEPANGHPVALG